MENLACFLQSLSLPLVRIRPKKLRRIRDTYACQPYIEQTVSALDTPAGKRSGAVKIHSFHSKLLSLFIGLIALVQIATFVAVLVATNNSVRQQAHEELRVASRVFDRLLHARGEQLLGKVQILVAEQAFREAVSEGDADTLRSLLADYGARVEADVAMLVSRDNELVASTHHDITGPSAFPFPDLLTMVPRKGRTSLVLMFRGQPYQFVLLPLRAPAHDLRVSMGFRIDERFAEDFKSLTTLDVSFWGVGPGDYPYFLASTLTYGEVRTLADALNAGVIGDAGGEPFILQGTDKLTLQISLAGHAGHKVIFIVQTSMTEALRPSNQLRLQLVALSVAALILSILAATLVARNVTRPVQALISAAEEIESGSYAHTVTVDRKDEIGRLAATFNSIVHRAHHDILTGLPNRAVVADRLNMSLTRAQRHGTPFALLLMDLNRFKEINDTLGHLTGDLVLQETAKRLTTNARGTDTVARLGGDEFLVLLENIDERRALEVAQKLIDELSRPIMLPAMQISLTVSTGIAVYPIHAEQPEVLLRRADIAMYHAKEAKLPVAVYQAGQDEKHLHQISLINGLPGAIDNNELFLLYQPKVPLHSWHMPQVEVLVRWRHPEHGIMLPDEFIPLAEEGGSIRALTGWVLKNAIRQCRVWREQGFEVRVSVNLSALDLLDAKLPDMIVRCLAAHDVPASSLILEITESAMMRDAGYALQVLNQLKETGIRLAIDDFGTGYSSLTQIKRLPVDEIKIDKSFVMNLTDGTDDAIIVHSTIGLGHNMGLKVTAEGVETQMCRSLLRAWHCDMVQGYFISRPLPMQQLSGWLQSHAYRSQPPDTAIAARMPASRRRNHAHAAPSMTSEVV